MAQGLAARRRARRVVLLVAVALSGCGSRADSAGRVTVVDSAGVALVTSPALDRPLAWRLERGLVLGGEEEGPATFTSVSSSSVDADASGRIYVLSDATKSVQVFDDSGAWLRTIGREGEGPGELVFPFSLAVSPEGAVSVYDLGKRALVRFGPGGDVLPEVRLQLQPPIGGQRHLAALAEGMLANASMGTPRSNVLAAFLEDDTTVVASVPMPSFTMRELPVCSVRVRVPPALFRFIAWDHRSDRLAVSASASYAVDVYRAGVLARSVRRDLPDRPADAGLAAREYPEGFWLEAGPGTRCTVPAERMVEHVGFEPFVPWIDDVALSPTGELWVRRFVTGHRGEGPVDVFDAEGAYLGTVPEELGLPVLFLPDGRIGVVERDELDVERLVVGRIVRAAAAG